jgi:hypothetical protein
MSWSSRLILVTNAVGKLHEAIQAHHQLPLSTAATADVAAPSTIVSAAFQDCADQTDCADPIELVDGRNKVLTLPVRSLLVGIWDTLFSLHLWSFQ